MAYRLTEWTALTDQDAEICHLIEEDDEDCDAIIATFSRDELGERLAAAALALANGDIALTDRIPPSTEEVEALRQDKARLDFLDACNAALNAHYGTSYGWELILSHNITRLLLGGFWAGEPRGLDLNDAAGGHAKLPSCRAAIDAKRPRRTPDASLPATRSFHG